MLSEIVRHSAILGWAAEHFESDSRNLAREKWLHCTRQPTWPCSCRCSCPQNRRRRFRPGRWSCSWWPCSFCRTSSPRPRPLKITAHYGSHIGCHIGGHIYRNLETLIFSAEYRVNHHLANLGWVDFDLDVTLILPSYSAHSAKLSSAEPESR